MGKENLVKKQRTKNLFALAAGNFVDQGEGQALSVLFPAIRSALNIGYGELGVLSGWRNLVQSVSSPLWGYLADRFSRKWIVVFGTGIWGIWTLACGFAGNYDELFWLRTISAVGLGCLLPPTFSMIADMYGPEERGRANGILGSIGFLGIILSVLILGWILGIPSLGWRWGFFVLGAASILSGILIALLVKEPARGAAEPELKNHLEVSDAAQFRIKPADVLEILRIPTMWVTFIQGIFGTAPWVVMGTYLVTWLVDQRGIAENTAPTVFAVILIGQAVAQYAGGIIADAMHRRDPLRGRIIISQVSILNGVWMTAVIFSVPMGFLPLLLFSLLTGCLIGWAGKGGRDPILQAVLRPELRSTAWSMIAAVEGGLSALSAFLSGWLAVTYGLSAAMILCVPVSWFILFLCWFGYYITFPRDSARLRAEMAKRSLLLSRP